MWATAVASLIAGSTGNEVFTLFESPLGQSVPVQHRKSNGIAIPAKYDADYHWILKNRMGKVLDSAVMNMQTPPNRRDRRFGLSRVAPSRIGPHYSSEFYDLVSFGNGTSQFDPSDWKVTKASFRGSILFTDAPPDWKRHAELIAPMFLAGLDSPLRWKGETRVFEARSVRISEPSCLSCHSESKVGDVAAILITSIGNARADDMARREDERQERIKGYTEYYESLKRGS